MTPAAAAKKRAAVNYASSIKKAKFALADKSRHYYFLTQREPKRVSPGKKKKTLFAIIKRPNSVAITLFAPHPPISSTKDQEK